MHKYIFLLNSMNDGNTVNERFMTGLLITAIGVIIVMAVLFILSIVFTMFGSMLNNGGKSEEPKKKLDDSLINPVVDDGVSQLNSDLEFELVAVITAAISAMTGDSCDKFIVRNIKKVNDWNASKRMVKGNTINKY